MLTILDSPTHETLKALTYSVLDLDPDLRLLGADQGDLEEAVKLAAARLKLAYSSESVRKAVDAVLYMGRRRGWVR
jgi:hypothetical protein